MKRTPLLLSFCLNWALSALAGDEATSTAEKEGGSSVREFPQYATLERGQLHSLDYRIFITDASGQLVSPWHDIPLFADESAKIYNMVVEIPRWTNAKMEMATREAMSPIRQDEKDGKPRFVANIFPHKGYMWNYGALPQTWEDPRHEDAQTGARGDNDPIDCVEIGSRVQKRGAVIQVKVLGVLALLDEGETDWKLIVIDVTDELAPKIDDLDGVECEKPGLLAGTREWLRVYKIPSGKPANRFGYEGRILDAEFAHKTIAQTHLFWRALLQKEDPKPLNTKSHVSGAAFEANQSNWNAILARQPPLGEPQPTPSSVDKWHYIRGQTPNQDVKSV